MVDSVDIDIVSIPTMVYKPTYDWGQQVCSLGKTLVISGIDLASPNPLGVVG